MDTKVGSVQGLYKPRETEGADTRYGLLHQDAYEQRRRERRSKKAADGGREDEANVSVEALLLFLEHYMARRFGAALDEPVLSGRVPEPDSKRPAVNLEALRLKAAQASQAYRQAAHVSRKALQISEPSADRSQAQPGQGSERDLVIGLIRDLRILANRDVASLKIGRGEGFIDSLAAAVLSAKQEIESRHFNK